MKPRASGAIKPNDWWLKPEPWDTRKHRVLVAPRMAGKSVFDQHLIDALTKRP